jgi:hypothetical protein
MESYLLDKKKLLLVRMEHGRPAEGWKNYFADSLCPLSTHCFHRQHPLCTEAIGGQAAGILRVPLHLSDIKGLEVFRAVVGKFVMGIGCRATVLEAWQKLPTPPCNSAPSRSRKF